MRRGRLEFYNAEKGGLIASLSAVFCPAVGDKINIAGENWLIRTRSFCVDYADLTDRERQLRACFNCVPTDDALSDALERRQ